MRALSSVCSFMSWMADLLSSSLSWILVSMSTHQDLNTNSASAEYLPCNLVIFGSHIHRNSFNACAAAAAETSAAIVAASCAAPRLGGKIPLTSKVLFIGPSETLWYGVDKCAGICVVVTFGILVVMPDSSMPDSRSGCLNLSPNRTCF